MGAFQTGFGFGQRAWENAQQAKDRAADRERQQKMDQIAVEAAERKARLDDIALREAQRNLDDMDGLRQAGSEMKAEEGFASGAPGQQIFSADQAQAQTLADINASAAELSGDATPAQVRQATGVTGGGKPAIAGPGLKVDNSMEARNKRQVEYLTNIGRIDEAQKLQASFAQQQQALYDAQRTGLFNTFASKLYNEGPAAAVAMYDAYNDGFTAELQMDGAGGVVIQRDGEGKEIGRLTFKNSDDLATQVQGLIFPERRLEAIQKSANEVITVKPGEDVYRGGVLLFSNTRPTSAEASIEAAILRAGGVGGASGSRGTGGSGLQGGLPEQIAAAIDEANKGADTAMRLSPDQMTQTQAYGEQLALMNPGIKPRQAANIALQLTRDPSLIKPSIEKSTGRVMGVVVGPDGTELPVGELDFQRLPEEVRTALSSGARKGLLDFAGGDADAAGLLLRIAHGDSVAKQQLKDGFMPAQIDVVMNQRKDLSREQATEVAARMFDSMLASAQGPMNAARQLVPAPKMPDAPRRQQPVTQQPVTQQAPSFVGAGGQGPALGAASDSQRSGQPQVDLSKSPTSLSMAFDTPEAKAALRERLRQASSGGPALNRVELLRARQLGLTK